MVRKWQPFGISQAGEGDGGFECQDQRRIDTIPQGARGSSWDQAAGKKAVRAFGSAPHILTLLNPLGHQAADAEGVYFGVLPRPEVHVSVLHTD